MKNYKLFLFIYNLVKKNNLIIFLILFTFICVNNSIAKSIRTPLHKPPIPEYTYNILNKKFGILSLKDIKNYKKIFHYQKEGKWDIAKKYIDKIDNDILMGHVLYQKYMHPTAYRSNYKELSNWLTNYRDLPGAPRIYKLATKRRPKGYKKPALPIKAVFKNQVISDLSKNKKNTFKKIKKKKKANKKSRQLYYSIKSNIRNDILTKSENRLYKISAKDLSLKQKDELFYAIAEKWYFRGDNDIKAFELSSLVANRSREHITYADWIAGLSAWRLKRFKQAQYHFEKLSKSTNISVWNNSAAAFWAARASLKNKDPEKFIFWLQQGSKNQRTFYGIICGALLGKKITISNKKPDFLDKDFAIIKNHKAIQRVIALKETGKIFLADKEAFNITPSANHKQSNALLKLTSKLNLPNTTIKLATKNLTYENVYFDSSAYPIPDWRNHSEFIVDQALVYAFVRQESRFNSNAKSSAGARGLMQLMPRTASFVAKDRSLRINKKYKLYEPKLNLELGQKYLKILMNNQKLNNNLFLITAAYNAGPSNLNKWLSKTPFNNDPLLFIESIPARETRIFIERVLANLWIYRMRFNQENPSLFDTAEGKWPMYISQDKKLDKITNLKSFTNKGTEN